MQFFLQDALPLVRIIRQHLFVWRESSEEPEAADAIGDDFFTIDDLRAADKLSEIVPVKCLAVREFCHEPDGVEAVFRLPEFQDDKATDKRLIERACGKHTEIVDVARLVALITGADFFSDDFGERKAVDIDRREWQALKIALRALRPPFRAERRRLVAADLELYFALPARVPVVDVGGINAPGQTVLRFIVAVVRDGELYAVKRLGECLHHLQDHVFIVVLLQGREIKIGGKPPLASDDHFPQAGAALESKPVENSALGQELEEKGKDDFLLRDHDVAEPGFGGVTLDLGARQHPTCPSGCFVCGRDRRCRAFPLASRLQ